MRLQWLGPLAASAALLLAAAGCTPAIEGLQVDKSFTYAALLKGKIAVGGMVSAAGTMDEGSQPALARSFRTQLTGRRKEITVTPYGQLVNAVGVDLLKKVLAEYKSGTVSSASLAMLGGKLAGTRYLILSRIESNEVVNQRKEIAEKRSVGSGRNRRQVNTGKYTIESTSTRSITATMDVFDLRMRKSVWSGALTQTRVRRETYEKYKPSQVVSIIAAVKGTQAMDPDVQYPYPPPISTGVILKTIFNGFARNMPRKS